MPIYQFPKDFIWGTATSAHQTEGNNTNSDWWLWEVSKKIENKYPLEASGIACDSYNRYEEDFDLCKQLNNNAVRISIEWDRIEPKEGQFDRKEIEHYIKVLKAAKERGLSTFVTLHHFTNPIWLFEKGGWVNFKTPYYFSRYAKVCAKEFGSLIDVYLTINEPQVYMLQSYINGQWPPNEKNIFKALIVQQNLIRGHNAAAKAIKSEGDYKVGIVKNIVWYEYAKSPLMVLDYLAGKILYFLNSHAFLLQIRNNLDVIGLNYYFTTRLEGLRINNLDDIQSDLKWWVNPKGLENVLLTLKRYNLPIYITENGCADATDRIRKDFIKTMLISSHNAIKQGVNLKGYFHWSLLDNYEWAEGFWPKFGLVNIDRKDNLKRIPRPSFYYYADICKSGTIEE